MLSISVRRLEEPEWDARAELDEIAGVPMHTVVLRILDTQRSKRIWYSRLSPVGATEPQWATSRNVEHVRLPLFRYTLGAHDACAVAELSLRLGAEAAWMRPQDTVAAVDKLFIVHSSAMPRKDGADYEVWVGIAWRCSLA